MTYLPSREKSGPHEIEIGRASVDFLAYDDVLPRSEKRRIGAVFLFEEVGFDVCVVFNDVADDEFLLFGVPFLCFSVGFIFRNERFCRCGLYHFFSVFRSCGEVENVHKAD